jgi:hypothetical protein
MFKKNKDKIGNIENGFETTSQKLVKQKLDEPELFSSPDIIIDDNNKSPIKTENIEVDHKISTVEKVENSTNKESPISDVAKELDEVIVHKEESGRVRKVSNRTRDNPAENTVTKTVEDILNEISSKIANQSEIIDEENLIDELADLNEDLNSVCIKHFYNLNVF